jgi:hypothetical protein
MVARKLWLLQMHFNSILNYIGVFSLCVSVSFFFERGNGLKALEAALNGDTSYKEDPGNTEIRTWSSAFANKTLEIKFKKQLGPSSSSWLCQGLQARPLTMTPGTTPFGSRLACYAVLKPKILHDGSSTWRKKKKLWRRLDTTTRSGRLRP